MNYEYDSSSKICFRRESAEIRTPICKNDKITYSRNYLALSAEIILHAKDTDKKSVNKTNKL